MSNELTPLQKAAHKLRENCHSFNNLKFSFLFEKLMKEINSRINNLEFASWYVDKPSLRYFVRMSRIQTLFEGDVFITIDTNNSDDSYDYDYYLTASKIKIDNIVDTFEKREMSEIITTIDIDSDDIDDIENLELYLKYKAIKYPTESNSTSA